MMLNNNLFVSGSIHQGGNRFCDVSRERQCVFISALLCKSRRARCYGGQEIQSIRY